MREAFTKSKIKLLKLFTITTVLTPFTLRYVISPFFYSYYVQAMNDGNNLLMLTWVTVMITLSLALACIITFSIMVLSSLLFPE
jgi:hypothetical protein